MIDVQIDGDAAQDAFDQLHKFEMLGSSKKHHSSEQLGKIMVRVMKRVAENYRAEIIRQTTQRYHVTAREAKAAFNSAIKLDKDANSVITLAHFHSDGYRRNLGQYLVYNRKRKQRRGEILRASVKKSSQPKGVPGAWYDAKSGRVVRRVHGRKFPVAAPAVSQIFKNPETIAAAKAYANEMFVKRIWHEFEREMGVLFGGRRNNGQALRNGGWSGMVR